MIAIKTSDHKAVAEAVKLSTGAKLVKGARKPSDGNIEVACQPGRCVLVSSSDAGLASDLSKQLNTVCVFAVEYPTSAGGGELVVFERGKRVRAISCGEDGVELEGKAYAFEAEVFDLDDDDPEAYALDADRVEDFCEELGIVVKLDERKPQWTIVP